MRCFLASSTPLRIASGTSPALPSPAPTCPCPSPTTTTALKLKRRPPLTTFATRLIWTTRSSSVSFAGSILATVGLLLRSRDRLPGRRRPAILTRPWYRNPARSKTTCSTPAVRARSATRRPDDLCLLDFRLLRALERGLQRGGGGERGARRVVDHLGVDVVDAAEDREARATGGALHAEADPLVPLLPRGAARGGLRHRRTSLRYFLPPILPALPALRRITSPE